MRYLFKLLAKFEGAAAYLRGRGYGNATTAQEVALALRLLRRPPLLVADIGANIGAYTAEIRGRIAGVEVHAFEPSAANVAKLRQRFDTHSGVTIVPMAVSDRSGTAKLFTNTPGSGLASLAKRNLDHRGISLDIEEQVQTIRFEDYWTKELAGRQVDIAKIDIEGYEFAALNGFGDAIRRTSLVQFEFGGTSIDTRTYFRDFWYFFKDHAFDLYRIAPIGLEKVEKYRESNECFLISNYIAVNRTP